MNPTSQALIESARQIANDVLFPRALEADSAGTVPTEQLQCLADAGFYGISTVYDMATIAEVIEIFASGCMTTTFVWTQHLGAAAAAHHSEGAVRAELAQDLLAGRKRGGVAFAHLLRPGTPKTIATPNRDGYTLAGTAPWVTGWGHIDVVHAAARDGDDLVWSLIDAVDSATLQSEAVPFAVVDSTQTKVLTYLDHQVPSGRVTRVDNYAEWRAKYQLGLRANGSLPLGVANRCCQLLDDPGFDARLVAVRYRLNECDPADLDEMAAARAAAALLAMHAATALVAKTGGSAVMLSSHAQRLMREAMFVLVQGQTPTIKAEMLNQLA